MSFNEEHAKRARERFARYGLKAEEEEMAPAQGIYLTPEELQNLLKTAVAEATKMNPIEQRKFDEEIARDRRRTQMVAQLGKIEEESSRRRREGCSHMRDAKTGDDVPKNWPTGEWVTSGQAYQNGTALVICQRCSSTWLFRPEPTYYNQIIQNGLLKAPPPSEQLTICPGCFELKPACRCKELYLAMKAEEAGKEAVPVAA